jgi:hypothetical protein
MKIHIEVPWVTTACSLTEGYEHFGRTYCLYVPWRWGRILPEDGSKMFSENMGGIFP